MSASTTIKKGYEAMALFAVLNWLGAAGLAMFLVSTSRVDGDMLRQVVAVLRHEDIATQDDDGAASADAQSGDSQRQASVETRIEREVARSEGERVKAELEQRLATINRILLQVTKKREAFEEEVADAAKLEADRLAERQSDGFKKQLELFEAMTPKTALGHLLNLPNQDDAARILAQMDTRRGKKLIEAAKRGDDLTRMRIILQRVRDVSPERSDGLEDGR